MEFLILLTYEDFGSTKKIMFDSFDEMKTWFEEGFSGSGLESVMLSFKYEKFLGSV